MSEIIPATGHSDNLKEIEEKISVVTGHVPLVHIDVTDATLTPRSTWPYGNNKEHFNDIKTEKEGLPHWEEMDFEVHLMVRNPEKIVEDWIRSGVKRIIVHFEAENDVLKKVREVAYGIEIGLAVNLNTELEKIFPLVTQADFVQLMSIGEIGESGHKFDDRIFDRIDKLRKEFPGTIISVDGGVNLDNADDLIHHGVTRLVVSSAIYESPDPVETLEDLLDIAK
jgi:ribulose-phosphate 3-epimerase